MLDVGDLHGGYVSRTWGVRAQPQWSSHGRAIPVSVWVTTHRNSLRFLLQIQPTTCDGRLYPDRLAARSHPTCVDLTAHLVPRLIVKMSSTVTATVTNAKGPAQRSKGGGRPAPSRPQPPSRAYDHLYDPVYHVSGSTVHNRNVGRAIYSRTVVMPDAPNMFSDLRHHPRAHLELDRNDPVPPARQNVRSYEQVTQQYRDQQTRDLAMGDHRGRDLLVKYHQRPAVPTMRTEMPNLVMESLNNRMDPLVAARVAAQKANANALQTVTTHKTVGTQSDYRESETQTDAWTSEYYVRPGSAPEVLTLASLSHGQGLPAGLNEVIMIERARAKRAWEKTLPDIADESKVSERVRMMEEQEAREWKWREEEIAQIQQRRLEIVADLVLRRSQQQNVDLNRRLESVLAQRRNDRTELRDRSQAAGLRELRRLAQARANVEPRPHDRNTRGAVDAYTNPGSHVYATVDREGSALHDANPERFEVDSHYKDTYDGLLDLEAWLPAGITNPRIKVPPKRQRPRGGTQHQKQRYHTKLEQILVELHGKTDQAQRAPRFQRRIPPAPVRGPVCYVDIPDPAEEKKKQAVLLLQRLLRGRAEQAYMYEGKELRRHLVEELRSTHALQKAEQEMKASDKAAVETMRADAAAAQATDTARDSAIQDVAGAHAGQTLDFLSKELIRLQEERRIQAFSMLAERQRRVREAEESGRREREVHRRQQTDEIFRQIVGVHQDCVDSFLEDVLIDATDATAEKVAREEIRVKAGAIDRVAQSLYDSGADKTDMTAMTISAELVSTFLLPEAEKLALRSVVANKQKRFQVAAHRELVTTMADVERDLAAARQARAESAKARSRPSTAEPPAPEPQPVDPAASLVAEPEPVAEVVEVAELTPELAVEPVAVPVAEPEPEPAAEPEPEPAADSATETPKATLDETHVMLLRMMTFAAIKFPDPTKALPKTELDMEFDTPTLVARLPAILQQLDKEGTVFRALDTDGDGTLDVDEILTMMDTDNSGTISVREFLKGINRLTGNWCAIDDDEVAVRPDVVETIDVDGRGDMFNTDASSSDVAQAVEVTPAVTEEAAEEVATPADVTAPAADEPPVVEASAADEASATTEEGSAAEETPAADPALAAAEKAPAVEQSPASE